jgi:hypothetical protein
MFGIVLVKVESIQVFVALQLNVLCLREGLLELFLVPIVINAAHLNLRPTDQTRRLVQVWCLIPSFIID